MLAATHNPGDTDRARQIWDEYQREHDVMSLKGNVAAIDPSSGQVWIGESGIDVADRLKAEGVTSPVYLVRVGYDHYVQKGRRCVSALYSTPTSPVQVESRLVYRVPAELAQRIFGAQ